MMIPRENKFGSVNFILDPIKMVEFAGQDFNKMLELNEFARWALNNEAEIRELLTCIHEGRKGCLWYAEILYRSLNMKIEPAKPFDFSDHIGYDYIRHRDIDKSETCLWCGRLHGKNLPCPDSTVT